MNQQQSTEVLIIGGSLVGLSAAVLLRAQGVSVIVVEKHAQSSLHPRAIGFTPRTLEIYRSVGLKDRIPTAPPDFELLRVKVESLVGKRLSESKWTPKKEAEDKVKFSPTEGATIAQDKLEPILRERAVELGADLRMSTEVMNFDQDENGVTATVKTKAGLVYEIRAKYLIAADGAHSPVRKKLGIGQKGRGPIRTVRSVLFKADLSLIAEAGIFQFEIEQPDFKAFLTTYNDGRWVLMFSDDTERDDAGLKEAITRAIGREDVPFEVITTGRWELTALIADSFSKDRIFLAGDSAHTLPPSRGGYGANTGIADAHNLSWKIASVLAGKSKPDLLNSYDLERRPISWKRHQQIFARPDYKSVSEGIADQELIESDDAMELGQLHRSKAVMVDGEHLPAALTPDEWGGQPGTRAPHKWVTIDSKRTSTIEIFEPSWVMFLGDDKWQKATEEIKDVHGTEIRVFNFNTKLSASEADLFRRALGLGRTGATLVRSDGIIGARWADLTRDPGSDLISTLANIMPTPNNRLHVKK